MLSRALRILGLGLVLTILAARGVAAFDLGAAATQVVADPARDVFYASTSTGEVLVIDVPTRSVTARIPVATVAARGLALDPDHDILLVAVAGDLVVVDLASRAVTGNVLLTLGGDVASVTMGRAGRAYALSGDQLSIVDTDALTEVRTWSAPSGQFFYSPMGRVTPDGTRLLVLDRGLSPASLYAYDVTSDDPCYEGEDQCHGCLGSNGQDFTLLPDGRTLLACGAPYYAQVLAAGGILGEQSDLVTGPYPNAVAISRDGTRWHVSPQNSRVLTFDSATSCPLHVLTTAAYIVRGGLVVASSGKLGVLEEGASFEARNFEIFDLTGIAPNRGGVRLRPVDASTGRPVRTNVRTEPFDVDATTGWADRFEGTAAVGPRAAGPVTLQIGSSPWSTVTRTVNVIAGAWTDLGDVPLDLLGTFPPPHEPWVAEALEPGTTTPATIHGIGFDETSVVSSNAPGVSVGPTTFVSSTELHADVTVDAGALLGQWSARLQVTVTAGGAVGVASTVAACASAPVDRIPPREVQLLWLDKTRMAPEPYLFHWTPVTLDRDGNPEVMGTYELSSSLDPRDVTGPWIIEPTTSRPWRPGVDGGSALIFFLVRARDAAGNLGP